MGHDPRFQGRTRKKSPGTFPGIAPAPARRVAAADGRKKKSAHDRGHARSMGEGGVVASCVRRLATLPSSRNKTSIPPACTDNYAVPGM